jgi:hypothetical protein
MKGKKADLIRWQAVVYNSRTGCAVTEAATRS